MAMRESDPSSFLPMVGDIVERNVDNVSAPPPPFQPSTRDSSSGAGTHDTTKQPTPANNSTIQGTTTTASAPPLRPIQAVVGQAFPLVRTRRSYGRQGTSPPADSSTAPATAATHGRSGTNTATRGNTTAVKTSGYSGLSAHVQPQDGTAAGAFEGDGEVDGSMGFRRPQLPVPEGGGGASMLPAGGSAQQHLPAHQWSAAEFEQLRSGYYVSALPASASAESTSGAVPPLTTTTATATATEMVATSPPSATPPVPSGEDFFALLFQCLRSTVRKHQQLALEVLLAHLQGLVLKESCASSLDVTTPTVPRVVADQLYAEAAALRERCLHGPNCGPFLFFVLEVLVSAGHPAMVELAATCLLLLLRNLPRGEGVRHGSSDTGAGDGEGSADVSLMTDALSELGNPAGDAPGAEAEGDGDADGEDEGTEKKKTSVEDPRGQQQDDAALPFSEVSELLRGPDARYGLEQLGFTNKVLATMQLLLYSDANEQGENSNSSKSNTTARAGVAAELESTEAGPHRVRSGPASPQLSLCHGEVIFLELLLCGGVGIGHRTACRRVAEDPHFLSFMEAQLSAVVMGQRTLEALMELLCVLQHLAHAPAALRSLLRGGPGDAMGYKDDLAATTSSSSPAAPAASFPSTTQQHEQQRQHQRFHETWLLFFIYVCSTTAKEVRTVRHVFALVWSTLVLRLCVRQNSTRDSLPGSDPARAASGLVYDMSDTLLSEGMAVGGALVLEMWFLQYSNAETLTGGTRAAAGSLDGYFLDAARTAVQMCRKPAMQDVDTTPPAEAVTSTDGGECAATQEGVHPLPAAAAATPRHEAVVAQRLLREFQWLSNAHFFATYVTQMRQRAPAVCYTLGGTAVETQESMQFLVRHVVMNPARLSGAFARFTSPLLSPSFVMPDITDKQESASEKMDDAPLTETGKSIVSTALQGWASAVQAVLHRWVSPHMGGLTPPIITTATTPSAASSGSTVCVSSFSPHRLALLQLAVEAAALYANTRVAAALAEVYPAVARDAVVGYAGLLTQGFEAACLRLRDGAARRLQVDELCTMAEAVQLLQKSSERSRRSCASARSLPDTTMTAPSGNEGRAVANLPKKREDETAEPQYDREARIGAFFLLHSIAISKHCLDVVPLILPLLQLSLDSAPRVAAVPDGQSAEATTHLEAQLSLLASLQAGIELTTVPVMLSALSGNSSQNNSSAAADGAAVSVTGAPRSWVLYPLYDTTFAAKHAWAQWLRRLLGLHRRVKDVVGWDAVLSHTLLWILTHRRVLWSTTRTDGQSAQLPPSSTLQDRKEEGEKREEEEEQGVSLASADALCALTIDLCGVLHDQTTSSSLRNAPRGTSAGQAGLSAAASRALEVSLAAYSDAPSEDGLPLLMHAVVAYVAAHSSARAALAALQVLLVTPVLPHPSISTALASVEVSAPLTDPSTEFDVTHATSPVFSPLPFSYQSAASQMCAWLQEWSNVQGVQAQSATASVHWSLEDVVALVQLVGPHLRLGRRGYAMGGAEEEEDQDGEDGGWVVSDSDDNAGRTSKSSAGACSTEQLWCVRCLTDGLLAYYVQQRTATSGSLSAMEKAVLQSTLEELEWFPPTLWPHVSI